MPVPVIDELTTEALLETIKAAVKYPPSSKQVKSRLAISGVAKSAGAINDSNLGSIPWAELSARDQLASIELVTNTAINHIDESSGALPSAAAEQIFVIKEFYVKAKKNPEIRETWDELNGGRANESATDYWIRVRKQAGTAMLAGQIQTDFHKSNLAEDGVILSPAGNLPDEHLEWVFTYGSLNIERSLRLTIGRDDEPITYYPALIDGYELFWFCTGKRPNYVDTAGQPVDYSWASLGIQRPKDRQQRLTARVLGALIGVTKKELNQLESREVSYESTDFGGNSPIKVARTMRSLPTEKTVHVFLPDSKLLEKTIPSARIRKGYITGVKKALAALHGEQAVDNIECLVRPPFAIEDAIPGAELANTIWRQQDVKVIRQARKSLEADLTRRDIMRRKGAEMEPIPSEIVPLSMSSDAYSLVGRAGVAALSIHVKASQLVFQSPDLMELAGFTDADARTYSHDSESMPSWARIDLVMTPYGPKVLEANCDSPAGTIHMDVLPGEQKNLADNLNTNGPQLAVPASTKGAVIAELAASWSRFRRRQPNATTRPATVAIVDLDPCGQQTSKEFQLYADAIELEFNCKVYVVDPTALDIVDDRLVLRPDRAHNWCDEFSFDGVDKPVPIDMVYKRIVWSDLLKAYNDDPQQAHASPIVTAYRSDMACVANSFRSRYAGNKFMTAVAKLGDFEKRLANAADIEPLTQLEKEVLNDNIPDTQIWGEGPETTPRFRTRVLHKELKKWVVKGNDGYGSNQVYVGLSDEWAFTDMSQSWSKGFIAQEYVSHGMMSVVRPIGGRAVWTSKPYILGVYVIGGNLTAIEAKIGENAPISLRKGASRTAVLEIQPV